MVDFPHGWVPVRGGGAGSHVVSFLVSDGFMASHLIQKKEPHVTGTRPHMSPGSRPKTVVRLQRGLPVQSGLLVPHHRHLHVCTSLPTAMVQVNQGPLDRAQCPTFDTGVAQKVFLQQSWSRPCSNFFTQSSPPGGLPGGRKKIGDMWANLMDCLGSDDHGLGRRHMPLPTHCRSFVWLQNGISAETQFEGFGRDVTLQSRDL